MSKPINNHFELKDVCRSAGLWYVGSFMIELIMQRERWENSDTKTSFIEYMNKEYSIDESLNATRTRVNAMIRIIESRMVEAAMELVIAADDTKLGCNESKINAQMLLDLLQSGELSY